MSIKVRSSLHSLVIIAVLIFSAVGPTIAYADGDNPTHTHHTHHTHTTTSESTTADTTPTAEDAATTTADNSDATTAEATATPEDPSAATAAPEDAATATPAPEEAGAATVEPTADGSAPASSDATAAPTTAEAAPATPDAAPTDAAPADTPVLNNVPDNTTVQVVNADGQSEPLATQAAADAIATTSDPIWCPQGQAPTPGANGCTSSFTSFTALLTFLSGNATYQGAGTIFVQQGAYTGGESSVNFNNYNLSNISNSALTIQGGWDTTPNPLPAGTSTFNNTSIIIGTSTNPWGGTLTLNNLTLNFNPTGQSGTGLSLSSQGDINLSNVTVTNSATGAGAELNSGGDVTIDSSHFDRNKTAGAIIRAKGNVTISTSSFSNPANGRRQGTGLDVVTDGSVSLFDVLADQNRQIGATINAGGPVAISGSVNPFTGTATTSFSGTKIIQGSTFLGYGLQIVTPSDIAISNIAANNNFLWGASLQAGGNVSISDSLFNANTTASPGFMDDTGLIVTSGTATGGGTVNISHIQANDNRLIGATITATRDVSIVNSFFDNNNGVLGTGATQTFHGEGLHVVSGDATNNIVGNITLTDVSASKNTLVGAHLEANGDVTISGGTFSNNTSSNNPTGPSPTPLGKGLEIIAGGDIFLTNVTADGNELDGVDAQGNCTTVFLTGGTYTNNGQYGLSVINANLLQLAPAAVFANNTAGNIFQDPGTCVFTAPTTPSTPPTGGTGSTPSTPTTPTTPVTSQQTGSVSTNKTVSYAVLGNYIGTVSAGTNLGKATLKSFLANSGLANGAYLGLFLGRYAYIYSIYGMQIVAYYPISLANVAMVGPH